MKTSALLLILPSFLSLVSATAQVPVPGITDISDVASIEKALDYEYDYVIAGGGTAGLAVAIRLADDPNLSVLVLEAGGDEANNTDVNIPALAASNFLTSADWAFFTEPQEGAAGRKIYWPRGKGLGGSSLINLMAWTRGLASDFNYWNVHGIRGWSFKDLLPFYRRAEGWNDATTNSEGVLITQDPRQHGKGGPIETSHSSYLWANYKIYYEALKSLGAPTPIDLDSGNEHGLAYGLATVHRNNETRCSSAAGYLAPAVGRKNLAVITHAFVDKIALHKIKSHPTHSHHAPAASYKAHHVAFLSAENKTLHAMVGKEAILSAGSLMSPGILERSGVGHPSILKSLGIKTKLAINGVGESLQDHPTFVVVAKVRGTNPTFDSLTSNNTFYLEALTEYAQHDGPLSQLLSPIAYLSPSDYMDFSARAAAVKAAATTIDGTPQYMHEQELDRVLHDDPNMEYIGINGYFGNSSGVAGANYFSVASCLQHSFARGSVHIKSKNAREYPAMDPRYLSHPADIEFMRGALKHVRRLFQSAAFEGIFEEEVEPGPAVQTDAEIDTWIRESVRTEYHPAGTLAMRSHEQNGVVGDDLKVYGLSNVRVVDASIIPLHINAHPQAALYAIAEKIAEEIKRGD